MTIEKKTLIFRGFAFAIDTIVCAVIAIGMFKIVSLYVTLDSYYLGIVIGILLLTFRDIFGKSLGKYLLEMSVVDAKTKTSVKFYKRLLKNITVPITIIEIPMVIFTKEHKRIGDKLSKTEVVIDDNSYALTLFNCFTNKC